MFIAQLSDGIKIEKNMFLDIAICKSNHICTFGALGHIYKCHNRCPPTDERCKVEVKIVYLTSSQKVLCLKFAILP